ncbi:MAG: FmdE family protein [Anaerolineae bacterium]|nr:MAG: FmdE family protein [Anaerolineae bacterium]
MRREHNFPEPDFIAQFLQESASMHHHLCPRQVLGVRMGLAGLKELGFIDERYRPRFLNKDKRLLTIMETDGCGLDGVAVATGCSVGKRTLRVVDHGKVAATLIDTLDGRSIRTSPSPRARAIAISLNPVAESPWHAYLDAYKLMPDQDLITIREVHLTRNVSDILSKPEARAVCQICNEEIINEREIVQENLILCRSCAGDRYYEEC